MRTILLLSFVAFVVAVPKPKLYFRNLFVEPNRWKKHPGSRIIGGQEAVPHSIPNQVLVEAYQQATHAWYCGGSLISPNYILTAGHCNDGADEVHVTLGAHKPLETENTQIKVVSKELKLHPEYNPSPLSNDIGIIKLPQPIPLTDAIKPIKLPSNTDNSYINQIARVSGWGLTDPDGTTLNPVLNYVDLKVVSNEECAKSFPDIDSTVLCTSANTTSGVCSGDSGGPLVLDGVQIGVVSFAAIFCMDGFPSGFTRITSVLDWIGNNTDIQV